LFSDSFNDAAKSAAGLRSAAGGLSRELRRVSNEMRGTAAGFDKFNDIKLKSATAPLRSARSSSGKPAGAKTPEGNMESFRAAAQRAFAEIKARVAALWENVIMPLGRNIAEWAATAWGAVKGAFAGAGAWFGAHVAAPVAGLFKSLWDGASGGARTAWAGVSAAFKGGGAWFFTAVAGPTAEFFKSLWNSVSGGAAAAWAGVSAAFRGAGAWLSAHVVNPVAALFKSLWNGASSGAGAAWAGVSAAFGSAGAWFSTNVAGPIKGFFAGAWDHVKTGASSAWAHVATVFMGASEWFNASVVKPISAFFGGLWSGIKAGGGALSGWMMSYVINPIVSAFKYMHNGVAGVMESAINGFIGAINGFIRGVNWVIDTINKIPGVSLGKMGYMNAVRVPRLAAGGLAMGAVTAIVGDNFNARQDPEVIAPLSSLQRMITNAIAQRDMAVGGAAGPIEIRLTLQNGAALVDLLIDPLNRTAKNLGYAPVFRPA
jgi:hypothetical protein